MRSEGFFFRGRGQYTIFLHSRPERAYPFQAALVLLFVFPRVTFQGILVARKRSYWPIECRYVDLVDIFAMGGRKRSQCPSVKGTYGTEGKNKIINLIISESFTFERHDGVLWRAGHSVEHAAFHFFFGKRCTLSLFVGVP